MKKLILLMAIFIPMLVSAMKIEKDEVDEFTGNRVVITSWESLDKGYVHIRFRHQNGKSFLDFKYISEEAIVIGNDDLLMFKSTSDDIAKFNSMSIYSGGIGDGAIGISGSAKWGINASYRGSIDWFTNNVTRLIRLYTTDSYRDFKVSEKDGFKLKKLALLLNGTLNGDDSFKTVSCTLTFLKKTKKKSTWEVVNEEYLKDVIVEEMMEKVNDWKSKTDDRYDYDVKIDKDK